MEYYGNNDFRDYYLAHYGVKGMKWGKHAPKTLDSLASWIEQKKKEIMGRGATASGDGSSTGISRPHSRKKKVTSGIAVVAKGSSIGNRPHSRKKKVTSGTAVVAKGSSIGNRPHSRKKKVTSGTASVFKGSRI